MPEQHPTTHLNDIFRWPKESVRRLFNNKCVSFTYKARGAIYKILKSLDKCHGDTILVPAFHCPTVVQPVLHAGYKVKFYQINKDLSIEITELLELITEDVAAVIIINYFGFLQDIDGVKERCHQNNCILLEDCSHSFIQLNPLDLAGERGDVSVFSFWKIIPSYIGGGIRVNNESFKLRSLDVQTISLKSHLKILKHIVEQVVENLHDHNLLKKLVLFLEQQRVKRKQKQNEEECHSSSSQAQELSHNKKMNNDESYPFVEEFFSDVFPLLPKMILARSNPEKSALIRRESYNLYSKSLRGISQIKPLFADLPDRICPWGYPVLIDNRSTIDFRLRKKGVLFFTFGEKLHPEVNNPETISSKALENAVYLSSSLICFSLHPDIEQQEIISSAEIIKKTIIEELV